MYMYMFKIWCNHKRNLILEFVSLIFGTVLTDKVKIKLQFTVQQSTKAQRGSRVIALIIL
jgi:hypothetical protein